MFDNDHLYDKIDKLNKLIDAQRQLIFILTEGVHFGNERVYKATKDEIRKLTEDLKEN